MKSSHSHLIPRVLLAMAIIAVLASGYMIIAPLAPLLRPPASVKPISLNEIQERLHADTAKSRLLIPKIGVDAVIYEGKSSQTLNKGIWHRPMTGNPVKGGNLVLTAHRYMYRSGPKTFYFLNKVTKGDLLIVWWEGTGYQYKVTKKFVVTQNNSKVETTSQTPLLTLYTCDLFDKNKRLVVQAELIQK